MATVSGSSTSSASVYNQLTASNKGIGGLVSGLDTESIIESLLMGTRSKISQQNQAKTLLQWKMTAYRGIATSMRAFQNKYVSQKTTTSSSYIGSYAFWNVNKASSSSDIVNVTAGSTATTGSFDIKAIKSVATSQEIKSGKFTQELKGSEIDLSAGLDTLGKTMQISYNGTSRTIKLDALHGETSAANVKTKLEGLLNSAFGDDMMKVTVDASGSKHTIKIEPKNPTATVIVTNNVDSLGIKANSGNRVPTGTTIGDMDWGTGKNLIGDTFSFSINGVNFTFNKDAKMSEVVVKVNSSTAGVTMAWDAVNECYTFTAKATGAGEAIVMEDVQGNFLHLLVGARSGNTVSAAVYSDYDSMTGIHDIYTDIKNLINEKLTAGKTSEEIGEELSDYFNHLAFNLTVDGKTAGFVINMDADTIQLYVQDVIDGNITDVSAATSIANAAIQSLNDQVVSYFGKDAADDINFSIDAATGKVTFSVDGNNRSVTLSAYSDKEYFDLLNDFFGFRDGDFKSQSNTMISGWITSVTGGGSVDYADLIANAGTPYTMEVTVNGVTKFIEVDLNLSALTPALNEVYSFDGSAITTRAQLLAALSDCESGGANDDPTEFARLEAILARYDAKLEANIRADLEEQLNDSLQTEFAGSAEESATETLRFTVSADGTITLASTDDTVVFAVNDNSDTGTRSLFSALGLDRDNMNNSTVSTLKNYGTLGDLGSLVFDASGEGKLTITLGSDPSFDVIFDKSMTLQELVDEINSAAGKDIASLENGKVSISAGSQEIEIRDNSSKMLGTLFGIDGSIYKTAAESYGSRKTDGTNAVVVFDDGTPAGVEVVYTSNTFTYKGVSIEITDVFNWALSDPLDPTSGDFILATDKITIRVSADTDQVVDNVKQFIEDYNALMDLLYSTITEKKADGYAPLTDEQKAEMSETEIANWEAEAKKGLLRSDSTLRSIMDQMRSVMYSKADPDGIGIWDIGITTMSIFSGSGTNYSNSGKLELTEEGEAKLRSMLENNIDQVRDLFTNEEKGLATKLNKVFTEACNEATGNHGSLVRMAGTDTLTGDNESYLSKRIDSIDEYIAKLKVRLESEYNRYWSKFSALETAISRMNAQMSYLDSMYSN